ncbi:MAG: hypothetical protein CO030_02830 [Candidatus Magasanikbacteria bacterium CG_4_9_14_0_2_um_filter_42_11]|uniref:Uncharacterized protein n=1 Tax=Candidatus Magasanikbacteria bacterium CG_4_9_14_0_2_um_filter_42_11 TaxID=1974643 RepID=A0A2M8F9U4_9BACT|nr:MAG: hypothetical protein COU34_02330 [Candidatus Magasanikbacteria bacterium CG10_big_fil_rev_8_21_14_0_10_43_9]PIY92107.1 MAG: hypothetical protein COY70_05030 [Candidatus Magasanikbacteria bacterium CG_4_10_14_0_8_um_filter_42_12]PJC52439.1 MAG: hypothetical protein CO030_02830 [Candidatus Magasanikbacteria bacterium CG_4_9_14_0_2_um_filter_42_11]
MPSKLPPPANWQIGKTGASIKFHNDVRHYLESCNDETVRRRLKEAQRQIETGESVLYIAITPTQFLADSEEVSDS